MIRVMFLDNKGEKSFAEVDPTTPHESLHSHQGGLPPSVATEVAWELAMGHISGWVAGMQWFRQAVQSRD
jgi:hypothetical protein